MAAREASRLRDERGLRFDSYEDMWRWLVQLEAFWAAVSEFPELERSQRWTSEPMMDATMVGMTDKLPSVGSTPVSAVTGDPVARVAADATVADVAEAIVSRDVGVIVVGHDERPAALMSERDVVRVVAAGKDPTSVPALDVASKKLVWCDADATVDEVAIRMMDQYIRHVLVEREGKLVGIVSARDLLGVYGASADLDFDSA